MRKKRKRETTEMKGNEIEKWIEHTEKIGSEKKGKIKFKVDVKFERKKEIFL